MVGQFVERLIPRLVVGLAVAVLAMSLGVHYLVASLLSTAAILAFGRIEGR